jgi:hypothetical protein
MMKNPHMRKQLNMINQDSRKPYTERLEKLNPAACLLMIGQGPAQAVFRRRSGAEIESSNCSQSSRGAMIETAKRLSKLTASRSLEPSAAAAPRQLGSKALSWSFRLPRLFLPPSRGNYRFGSESACRPRVFPRGSGDLSRPKFFLSLTNEKSFSGHSRRRAAWTSRGEKRTR